MAFDYQKLHAQLIDEEGLRLRPYTDTRGKITIGVGRNLTDVGISEPEAMTFLSNDIMRAVLGLDHDIPRWKALDDVRARVIISMAFNMGIGKLMEFRKFRAAIEAGEFGRAAAEMEDSDWYAQVGRRGPKLKRWMLTGKSIAEQP